jgi:ABC-type cobalamin/Fe3+-siderophores transport system ATPase subunit
MSSYKITIRNYRSIPYNQPLEFSLDDGITFVLGINNVGKTNLLKLFYEFRHLFTHLKNGTVSGAVQSQNFDFLVHRNSMNEPIIVEIENEGLKCPIKITSGGERAIQIETNHSSHEVAQKYRAIGTLFSDTFYIPPLRSISKLAAGQNLDVVGGPNFINQWDNWANGENIRNRTMIDLFKAELRDLFRFNRFDIQPSMGNDSLLITTDDGQFRIEELGDGIAHFILVLGNVLMQRPSIILIDEPENGLHPKMQEVFLRALASKCKFGVLATSHSIGLARSTGDQIFSLTRDGSNGPRLSPFGEHHPLTISQSLTELGYSQFAEIGGNHLLLVEGQTDIKSFREILRKYGIEHHFLIWSLGGAEFIGQQDKTKIIDELNEFRRLNPKSISVIFDSERTSFNIPFDPRFQIFCEACAELKFQIFPTEFNSTENYLKQAAIDKIVGNSFKTLQPFEKFGSVGQKWNKNKNWLMFREMKKEDFKGTELDKFITMTLLPLCN